MYVYGNIRIRDDLIALVGRYYVYNPNESISRVTVITLPNGKTVFERDSREMSFDFADMIGDVVRVRERNRWDDKATDVFYDLRSEERLSMAETDARLASIVAQGRLDDAETWKSQVLDTKGESEAILGELVIHIEEGWLVCTRRIRITTCPSDISPPHLGSSPQ